MNKEEFYNHLSNLCVFTPRFWENEVKTANYIKKVLEWYWLKYYTQKYNVSYPKWENYWLFVDWEMLEVLPCWFKSGEFKNNFKIIDSSNLELSSEKSIISYNSKCDFVSTPVIYENTALAVKKQDIEKIKTAENIYGFLEVSKYDFIWENIFLGNIQDPKKIIFCHYDSFWWGALDNWTWTSLLLLLSKKLDLSNYLIVFAGSEEISLENTDEYWCYGYRKFEEKYLSLMEKTKEIIIFDSFGYKENEIIADKNILKEAFLIKNKNLLDKVKMYASKFEYILENYHTPADTPEKITNIDFEEILSIINN